MSASASSLPACRTPSARRRVDKQLKLVDLDQWAKKYAHELSGGMQQRVGLARAFATEAPILLMDEPFSALDPLIRTKLQDELLQLQATLKKTIIFVSHDLEEALKIGSHITIMEGGRIVQTGAPEDIVLRPANDYVRDFIANVNPLSVLTAWNVMRDRRDLETAGDGWVWLDRRKTTRFKIDKDGLVAAAERDGRPAVWVSCDDVETLPEDAPQVFWARPGTSLKTVMLAMHRSQTSPVALFDEQSRFVGAIGIRDVLSGGAAPRGLNGGLAAGCTRRCRCDNAQQRGGRRRCTTAMDRHPAQAPRQRSPQDGAAEAAQSHPAQRRLHAARIRRAHAEGGIPAQRGPGLPGDDHRPSAWGVRGRRVCQGYRRDQGDPSHGGWPRQRLSAAIHHRARGIGPQAAPAAAGRSTPSVA